MLANPRLSLGIFFQIYASINVFVEQKYTARRFFTVCHVLGVNPGPFLVFSFILSHFTSEPRRHPQQKEV